MTKNENWLPSEDNIEHYLLLIDMLKSQRKEFDLLSKKKTNEQLNLTKVKMVNRVLEPLRKLFGNEPTHEFLDIVSEEDLPTNSDIVLIISQYETAISRFRSRYYRKDDYQLGDYGDPVHRWMTQEFPPDYYQDGNE